MSDEELNDRWIKWVTNEVYKNILNDLQIFYENKGKKESTPDYYTPHDSSHCLAVEKLVISLIDNNSIDLSETERFILCLGIWTHDLGMFTNIAREYLKEKYSAEEKRKIHEKISGWFIGQDNEFHSLFSKQQIEEPLMKNYINTVSIINEFHRRKNPISKCPEERFIMDDPIKTSLLAALLRLGDTLHIDTSRYDKNLYNILQIGHFDRTARLHWLKSYVVSSVVLKPKEQTIIITIDLPEPDDNCNREWDEHSRRLSSLIRDDVLEDVIAVEDIFRKHNIQCYTQVKVQVHYCQTYNHSQKKEIQGIVNDLHIVLSPSTSNVIRKANDSIIALADMPFENYEIFYNQVYQLTEHLGKLYAERPCHVGLGKIYSKLKNNVENWNNKFETVQNKDIASSQKELRKLATEVQKNRKDAISKICKIAPSYLKGINNILLFGYSEIVSKFLSEKTDNSFKDSCKLYIFECSGKRRYSLGNNLEYNDGLHYAFELSNVGFKNITILPDLAIATLLENKEHNIVKDNSRVLFGANGIEENTYDCGHSSGHLSVAIIAKSYNIPIVVIADSFKIGKIDWKPNLKREQLSWLTGEKQRLDDLKIRDIGLLNYREDRIPKKYIDKIILEVNLPPLTSP